MAQPQCSIVIRGAREHNLQDISLDIPRDQLVVITGLSGSGKSSLAFDTIYAEGQRRYLESLNSYARQFLGMMERPDVDYIDGLSPVIAIEQKTVSRNPRSTVGTVTEVYDFLRLLFARVGTPHSLASGKPLRKQSSSDIVQAIVQSPPNRLLSILAPVVRGRKGHYRELFEQIAARGFTRVRVDGAVRAIQPGMQVGRYKTHDIEVVVDRIKVQGDIRQRVRQSVRTALEIGSGTLLVAAEEEEDRFFSKHLFDPATGQSFAEPSPGLFSFNSPYGWCPRCQGMAISEKFDDNLVIPIPSRSIEEDSIRLIDRQKAPFLLNVLDVVGKRYGFSRKTPLNSLSPAALHVVLHGAGDELFEVTHVFSKEGHVSMQFDGVYGHYYHRLKNAWPGEVRRIKRFMRKADCNACGGTRLKPEALAYRIAGRTIADLVAMNIESLANFVKSLGFDGRQQRIAKPILKEIAERLGFMLNVGVGYLSLDRVARTLSGGESQRIRLATQVGTQLTGVLYVLDEPSIGLHPRDNRQLIASLKLLRDMGNSVLVVEHDRDMIESADFVVDLGPGAGEQGGHVISAGSPQNLAARTNGMTSLTVEYLTGQREIAVPQVRRSPGHKVLTLRGAKGHNLKGDTLVLPLGLFVCVTGVSGSGKSTLISQTLKRILQIKLMTASTVPLEYESITGHQHLGKIIAIDQKPIGRTPRSNPATYTGVLTPIRDLFAATRAALIRGYAKGRFSFNVQGGRCEHCKGAGMIRLEMDFLPDVFVTCDHCNGQRFNKETLQVLYKGQSIADVLDMTVDDAAAFFKDVPSIARKLRTLQSVGLGYIRLGQQSTTISGGEAQRVKLSKELSRPGKGDTLYVLDEPTTGLHFEDIRYLLNVLQALVGKGNTVVVIEHNMDVIKVADYILDLGPDGGEAGGRILFGGSPEELAQQDTYTGTILRSVLAPERAVRPAAPVHSG